MTQLAGDRFTSQVPFAMSDPLCVHSRSYQSHRLATEWERAVSNMHEQFDRYLAR